MAEQSVGGRLKAGWLAIVARFGHVQTLVMLGFFYALLLGPAALVSAVLRQDPLDKQRSRPPGSVWHDADSARPSLERAKLQT